MNRERNNLDRPAPVQAAERISEIDIVRGIALFGILMVNMAFYKYPVYVVRTPTEYAAGAEQLGAWLIQLFFTGNFYAIFSFLFGLGFYIFMDRTLKKGFELAPLYRRRLFGLMFFGLVHLLLFWSGDILFTYSLGGFFLLMFRNKSLVSIRRWIIGLFIFSLLLYSLFEFLNRISEVFMPEEYDAIIGQLIAAGMVAYREYGFLELAAFRIMVEVPYVAISLVAWIPAVLGFFLCGLYVGKLKVFENLPAHRNLLLKARNAGLTVGLVLLLCYVVVEIGLVTLPYLTHHILLSALNYAASIFLFPAYIALILLAVQGGGFCSKFLAPVAYAGRMALTNYLSQTLICVFLFYGFGLGFYARVSVINGILITLAIFLVQVAWSNIWLRHFKYGPMEWVWRILTYKRLQPLKIRD